jgi:hypothetical protein
MAYPIKTHKKAFELYRKLRSIHQVSKRLKITDHTLMKWRDDYDCPCKNHNWEARIQKIDKIVREKEIETDTKKEAALNDAVMDKYARDEIKNLKILDTMKQLCVERLKQKGAIKLNTARDVAYVMDSVIKLERLIRGEPTDHTKVTGTITGSFKEIYEQINHRILAIAEGLNEEDYTSIGGTDNGAIH